MAEVIGVVASGISIAQLSGQIITNGLKIKALVDDIHDAPETINMLLDELQILAEVFKELDNSHGVSLAITSPLPLKTSLHTATLHCKKAADQLNALASDLSAQIESHKRVRQKIGRIRVVMKRDNLAKYERRLQAAYSLLSLTQQSYFLSWQKFQPQIVAEEVIRRLGQEQPLEASQDESKEQNDSTQQVASSHRASRTKRPVHATASDIEDDWKARSRTLKLGHAYITGVLEVMRSTTLNSDRTRNRPINHHGLREKGSFSLGIKGRCPLWLTSWAFDSVLGYSQRGWTHSLRVYRLHSTSSKEGKQIEYAMGQDSIPAIRELVQNSVFHPRDSVYLEEFGSETSFVAMAMGSSSWAVGNYLLECGSESQHLLSHWTNIWQADNERIIEMLSLLEKEGVSDLARITLLGWFKGDVGTFNRIRRRIWSDEEFFHDTFNDSRFSLAWDIAYRGQSIHGPAIVCHILSPCGEIRRQDLRYESPRYQITELLALALGNSFWEAPESHDGWATVTSNIIRLLGDDWNQIGGVKRVAPLQDLLWPLLYQYPINSIADERKYKLRSRLLHCQRALKSWLTIMASAGVDLSQYGEWEECYHRKVSAIGERTFQVTIGCHEQCQNNRMKIGLLGLQYGEHVDSWKLIWSEPTDELVGDFWRAVEADVPVSIPGAWLDDSEEE